MLTYIKILGNEIGREWKMFDVGGTRTSVRLFYGLRFKIDI